MIDGFRNSIALRYSNDLHCFEAVDRAQLHWSTTDSGTTHGAILVERFRTFNRAFHHLDRHWARLSAGAKLFGIQMQFGFVEFQNLLQRLLNQNAALASGCADVGVVLLVSPGDPEWEYERRSFTCMMHLTPLPWVKLAKWYRHGVNLIPSKQVLIPANCWDNQIKTRSRLNYWLADRAVSGAISTDSAVDDVALLMTSSGNVGDTSVSNVLIVQKDGCIVSPRLCDVLPGCTLSVIDELVRREGRPIVYKDVSLSELCSATEVLLTGSSGGVWSAVQLDGRMIGDGKPGPVCDWLTGLYSAETNCDFRSQAG